MMMLKRAVKEAVKHGARALGYQVRSLGPDSMGEALKVLKMAGLDPRVVIDVGVHAVGTPELYATFPNAKHLLVEPAREFEPAIRKLTAGLKDCELIIAAASDREGQGTLRITRNSYVHTSLVDGTAREAGYEYENVPLVTVAQICRERRLSGPYLLKVDVDGVDLDVLKGAASILDQIDVVIVEAPVDALLERANYLKQHGMMLWGIVDPVYFDQKLWQVDLIFLSERLKSNPAFRPWADPAFKYA